MTIIIDYGMGNLHSVLKAFKRLGKEAVIASNLSEIEKADRLILPGVGHFKKAMENLYERGLVDLLQDKVLKQQTPILGICLGMQLFTKHSEEGDVNGLGWIDAETKRFTISDKKRFRVPHMGWNNIVIKNESILLQNIPTSAQFYFVHSYHVISNVTTDIVATTDYGYPFVSVLQKNNIFATQFHPEKSHSIGLNLLKNFIELT